MLSASASRLDQQIVPHRRGQVSHRLARLEDGLEHHLVETLMLDLAVSLGLGYHCRRSAASTAFPIEVAEMTKRWSPVTHESESLNRRALIAL